MNPVWKKILVTAVATGLATGSLALAEDEKKPEEGAGAPAAPKEGCSGPGGCGGKKGCGTSADHKKDKKKMKARHKKEAAPAKAGDAPQSGEGQPPQ
jgi:hypothetical protein